MVVIAIGLNIVIAFLCLVLAWKLVRFRQTLKRTTRALILAQRKTDQVLCNAPHYILRGQTGTVSFHEFLGAIGPSQQSLLRWFTMLTLLRSMLGYRVGPRANPFFRRPSPKSPR